MTEIQVRFNNGRIVLHTDKTLLDVIRLLLEEGMRGVEKISFTLNGERVILVPEGSNLVFEYAHNQFMNHPFLPGLEQ
jgi:hypothetical protein